VPNEQCMLDEPRGSPPARDARVHYMNPALLATPLPHSALAMFPRQDITTFSRARPSAFGSGIVVPFSVLSSSPIKQFTGGAASFLDPPQFSSVVVGPRRVGRSRIQVGTSYHARQS
jgi:hypothetical protein